MGEALGEQRGAGTSGCSDPGVDGKRGDFGAGGSGAKGEVAGEGADFEGFGGAVLEGEGEGEVGADVDDIREEVGEVVAFDGGEGGAKVSFSGGVVTGEEVERTALGDTFGFVVGLGISSGEGTSGFDGFEGQREVSGDGVGVGEGEEGDSAAAVRDGELEKCGRFFNDVRVSVEEGEGRDDADKDTFLGFGGGHICRGGFFEEGKSGIRVPDDFGSEAVAAEEGDGGFGFFDEGTADASFEDFGFGGGEMGGEAASFESEFEGFEPFGEGFGEGPVGGDGVLSQCGESANGGGSVALTGFGAEEARPCGDIVREEFEGFLGGFDDDSIKAEGFGERSEFFEVGGGEAGPFGLGVDLPVEFGVREEGAQKAWKEVAANL